MASPKHVPYLALLLVPEGQNLKQEELHELAHTSCLSLSHSTAIKESLVPYGHPAGPALPSPKDTMPGPENVLRTCWLS